MNEKILHLTYNNQNIPITFKKNRRSKKISIRINEKAEITVSMPERMAYSMAKKFVLQNKKWIEKHYLKRKNSLNRQRTFYNDKEQYYTHEHTVLIQRKPGVLKPYAHINHQSVNIFISPTTNVSDEQVQQFIRSVITETYRKEAKIHLPERVHYLAAKYGFKYNKVFIKNNKTRWGSCSSKNNINLNLHLMRLPQHLSDYVILHELTHTIHKNHSKKFWASLDNFSVNARSLSKELSQYSIAGF